MESKVFKIKGVEVLFTRNESGKFDFLVNNDKALTEKVKAIVTEKTVKEKSLWFAAEAIAKRVIEGVNDIPLEDFTTILNQHYQRVYKTEPVFTTIGIEGADHCPDVSVVCYLPKHDLDFSATASNQRIARRLAAKQALEYLETLK